MTPEIDGEKATRAMVVLACMSLAFWAIVIGAVGHLLGAW
tara:strand:+ start:626 stop:745 length:120 start_codon:yes stop_codon:yes gene_type:complete